MTTFHELKGSPVTGQGSGEVAETQDQLLTDSTRHRYFSFTKGAVEIILDRATGVLTSGGVVPLDRRAADDVIGRMSADGLRVLGLALREWDRVPAGDAQDAVERVLILVGFAGMMDPPRDEAREAVALCREGGHYIVVPSTSSPIRGQVSNMSPQAFR